MSDAEYLIQRAHEELNAAMRCSDLSVRNRHLELADAYAFRLREVKRQERRLQAAHELPSRTMDASSAHFS